MVWLHIIIHSSRWNINDILTTIKFWKPSYFGYVMRNSRINIESKTGPGRWRIYWLKNLRQTTAMTLATLICSAVRKAHGQMLLITSNKYKTQKKKRKNLLFKKSKGNLNVHFLSLKLFIIRWFSSTNISWYTSYALGCFCVGCTLSKCLVCYVGEGVV